MGHEIFSEELRQELEHSVPLTEKGGRIHVLLVEDNGADAELLLEAFGEIGTQVDCLVVRTPLMALEAVDSRKWDLVLMDLRLGPHEGHDLLLTLHERGVLPALPLFVLSSSAAKDDIDRANRHEIHGYLRKPFTIEGWFDLARQLVGSFEGRQHR